MKTLYLHIGLQKTGTSTVQMQLMRPNGPLVAAGIDYLPAIIAPAHAHHNAAWDSAGHKRHQPALPGVDALLAAITASPADRLFVSSEDFSLLPDAHVAALADRLQTVADVRPILCLRNPLDWAESLYAQACKRGNPGSFETYANRLDHGGRLAFDRILDSWRCAFGDAATTILIYEDHADITDAFVRLLDLPGTAKAMRKNRSLNERFVIASQHIITDCKAGRLILNGQAIAPAKAALIARTLLKAGPLHPAFVGSPVFLRHGQAQAFLDRFRRLTDRIAQHVALPAPYRQVSPDRRDPWEPGAADVDYLMNTLLKSPEILA